MTAEGEPGEGSVFGKWYELPSRTVEAIKRTVEETEAMTGSS
jgi:hypothetical protein